MDNVEPADMRVSHLLVKIFKIKEENKMLRSVCNFFTDSEEDFRKIRDLFKSNGYEVVRQNALQGIVAVEEAEDEENKIIE